MAHKHRGPRVACVLTLLVLAPSLLPLPADAGSVLSHSTADFTNGKMNNTAVFPNGLNLETTGNHPYNWTNLGAFSPEAQWRPVFDYDAAHGVMVMTGGTYGSSRVWKYNLQTDDWKTISVDDTSTVQNAIGAGAIDSINGEIVATSPDASITYTFNLTTHVWTNKNVSSAPLVGYGYSLAFDADRGEMVLFGGQGFNPGDKAFAETWSYNLSTNTWTNRTTAVSPPGRAYASMAYDRAGKVMVLIGGNSSLWSRPTVTLLNDTWTYDLGLNLWTNKTPPNSPPVRELSGMAYDSGKKEFLLYGGIAGTERAMGRDTWTYNLSRNAWTELQPIGSPPPRSAHSMAYDPMSGKTVLVGGDSPAIYNWRADSWSYDPAANNWTMGTLKAPSTRSATMIGYDSDAGEVLLFGGWDRGITDCGDTWSYNVSQARWTLLSPKRACEQQNLRSGYQWSGGHAMAYDEGRKEMVLYNPQGKDPPETFAFNRSTNTWTNLSAGSPPPVGGTPVIYHRASRRILAFEDGNLYAYLRPSNKWSQISSATGPTQNWIPIVELETTGELLAQTEGGETWTYNFTRDEWTELSLAEKPSDRWGFSLTYDSSRDEVLLYGGMRISFGVQNDTWRFDVKAGAWQQLAPDQSLPGLFGHKTVYIRNERETMLFGGSDAQYGLNRDIWTVNRLRFTGSGNYTSPAIELNGTAFFGAVTWDASVPAGTSLRLQLRSGLNETALNATNFTGPDGTAGTFYTSSGQRVSGVHNGSRWMQYRVFLNTTDEKLGPVLSGLKIHYNLIPVVNVTSPKTGDAWTGTKPVKWNASEPDRDNATFDIHLLDAAGRSTLLASNLTWLTRSWNWDTMTARSGSYRIRVVARDDNRTIPGEGNGTSGWFVLAHPNNRPVVELSTPAWGAVVNSSSVTLEWRGTDGDGDPLKYYVFVGREEFFVEYLPGLAAETSGTSATISNLADKAMYYWSVLADDGIENSTLPPVLMFTVDIPPPPPVNHPPEVSMLAPTDGENITNTSTRLAWSGTDQDGDRLAYSVFISEADFNFSGLPPLFTRTNDAYLDTGNLTDGATYYWAVIANDGRVNSTALTVWKFTVRLIIPADTPRVSEYSPKGTRTPLSPIIIIGFDREMNALSVVSALSAAPTVNIIGFNSSGNRFFFYLGSPLLPETKYNVTVSTAAKSGAGRGMFRPFGWSFTTLAPGEVDCEPPAVLVTDPLDGAQNVDRWKNITVYFSEAMAQTPTKAACSIAPHVNGTWHWKDGRGFTIRFVPAAGFGNGTYNVTVSRAATDESGNPLAESVTFSFKVGVPMTGKPKLLARSLVGEGVRTNAQLVLAFDRQMDPASVISAFRISPTMEGNWTYDNEGKIFTFTPAKKLRAGATYSVAIGTSARDVDGNQLASEANWTFKTVEASGPVGIGMAEWLLLALVVIVGAGIAAFAVTRQKKASGPAGAAGMAAPKGFAIEDIFLMYNDGRLILHTTRRMKADMDVDVFTSMLTAMQAFVKDSFGRDTKGELGSMEFGGDKVLFEKGKRVIIAVVITGGEPAGFRDEMKAAVRNIESEYDPLLQQWDGDATPFSDARRFLSQLGAYNVAQEELVERQKVSVSLKSEVEFYQGFVRLKVAVKNTMASVITHASFKLVYDRDTLRLDHTEPQLAEERGEIEIGIVGPGEKKAVAFYLDPQICTESYLEGVLTFKDSRGNLETVKMPRKLTSVVCPILFTDENINTAMLKRMVADELDKKDSKVFTIPANMTSQKAFEVGKAAVQHHDVRLVRELGEDRPYRAEAWYFGKAKGRPDRLVVQVRIIPEMSFLEFSVSSDSVLMLTGLLAELRTDLNKELESHHLKGAMKQVTDRDDIDAVAEIRQLLEKAGGA